MAIFNKLVVLFVCGNRCQFSSNSQRDLFRRVGSKSIGWLGLLCRECTISRVHQRTLGRTAAGKRWYILFVGNHSTMLLHQRSTCVNHEAVNNPDKAVKGKSVTGGGTADCSRHNLKRPCGFADLQKGERYVLPNGHDRYSNNS